MAATLIALRWRLLRNTLTRSLGALIGSIFGALYGLAGIVALVAGAIALGGADGAVIAAVQGLYAALITLGWVVWPLLFSGVDGSLDPRSMSAWIAPSARLARALLLAGLAGLPGVLTCVALLLPALSWAVAGELSGVLLSLVAAPVGALTCVLLSRVLAVGLGAAQSRRARELTGVLGILLIVLIAWLPNLVLNSHLLDDVELGAGVLSTSAAVAVWSPVGWWAGLPTLAVQGAWIQAVVTFALALAMCGALLAAWTRVVFHVMTHPASGSTRARAYGVRTRRGRGAAEAAGAGADDAGADSSAAAGALRSELFFERFLPTPAAATASRCLTYWLRDPRYLVQGIMFLVLPFVVVLPGVMGGAEAAGQATPLVWGEASRALLVLPAVAAAFWSSLLANDLGMDSTALWQQVSAGVSGRHDRLGRIAGAWSLQVPLLTAGCLAVCGWCGTWWMLPALLGLSLTVLAAGTAWSCLAMVMVPYETQAPGESVLKSKTSGMAFLGSLVLMLGWLVAGVVAVPVVVLTIMAVVKDSVWLAAAAGGIGLVELVIALVVAVRLTGSLYERKVVSILATIRSWPGHADIR